MVSSDDVVGVYPDGFLNEIKARPNGCEEASILSTLKYIPCNAPATRLIFSPQDNITMRMCDACAYHSVKNRRMEDKGVYRPIGPVTDLPDFLDEVAADASASAIPTEEKLKRLSGLAQQLIDAEDQVASLENQIKAAKEEVGKLSELAIPELMSDVGVREFKLSNGLKVTVKPFFSGKITDENAEEAYDWLDQRGFSDIVKNEVVIKARRTDTEQLQEIMDLAAQLGFDNTNKLSVHHQTLSAFIKEQITEGNDLPRELFGVYTGFKTKIGR